MRLLNLQSSVQRPWRPVRPFQMLLLEPILLFVTIYTALIYGILYLLFEAYPYSFQRIRGWKSAGVAALPFLGILLGVILGCVIIIVFTKLRFARKMQKHGRVVPEERLVPMFLGSVLLPIGLFWFGWTSSRCSVGDCQLLVIVGFFIMLVVCPVSCCMSCTRTLTTM